MLRSISFVNTPPNVSIPSESGVTSKSKTSLTSPASTPPWIAAPIATHSSGLIPLNGSLPVNFLTASTTAGIRVEPPTIKSFAISLNPSFASRITWLTLSKVFWTKYSVIWSNLARVKSNSKCLGPVSFEVINGKSIFAFSLASFKRCIASLSLERSIPSSFLNSSTSKFIISWSKSSPPKRLSPAVAKTSNTPSAISRSEISNVPPPKSYTKIFWFLLSALSKPYARAAAVGSLIMRITSSPAILPASLVAWRWLSVKYAGTVITAWVTFSPK